MTKVAKTVDAVFTTDAYRLSDDLDLVALRAAFEADGRLQIRDVLDPLSAQALAAALDADDAIDASDLRLFIAAGQSD